MDYVGGYISDCITSDTFLKMEHAASLDVKNQQIICHFHTNEISWSTLITHTSRQKFPPTSRIWVHSQPVKRFRVYRTRQLHVIYRMLVCGLPYGAPVMVDVTGAANANFASLPTVVLPGFRQCRPFLNVEKKCFFQ